MDFWRKENPIMRDGTVLKGGMWDHQRKFWECKNFIAALVTGYGGGKTLIGCKKSISMALQNSGIPFMMVSPSFKMARKTTIFTMKELLQGKKALLGNEFSWRYLKSDSEFLIKYHGRTGIIWVASGDDPEALKGPNLCGALIDEPFIQDREVFNQMMARIRHPAATRSQLLLTGTPEDLNWGYDILEGEDAPNFDSYTIHASSRDNKALGDDYADRLEKAYTAAAAAAFVNGGFVPLSDGLVYYAFSRKRNVIDFPAIPKNSVVGFGLDFNVNPMSAAVFWKVGNHLHFFDEILLPNSDTEEMCSVILDQYGQYNPICYPDATGKKRQTSASAGMTDFRIIRSNGIKIEVGSQNPPRRDRFNIVNGKLNPKQGQPTLTFSSKCTKMIRYMESYSHEKMHKQEYMSHILDARDYPVARLFPMKDRATQHKLQGI